MSIRAWLHRRASERRNRRERPSLKAFREAAARLGPGDVALDCGANVGAFTVLMAESGARVYAFEPNPAAFEELVARTSVFPNVTALQGAVTAAPGPVKLFLHKWTDHDPVYWSTGSSVLAGKNNVRSDSFVTVATFQLPVFFAEFGISRVHLLKMDIEGAEVEVLNQLLDLGLHTVIDRAFVEVHDRRVAELAEPTRLLRQRLRSLGAEQFCLDWR